MFEEGRRFADTAAGAASYVDIGDGPTALFIHGVGTNAYLWRNVMPRLAAHRRCMAIDLPLHGQSPLRPGQELGLPALANFVDAFCDELGLDEVDLVANDTGGAIAQIFAVGAPERIRSIALTNCETHDNVPPPEFKSTIRLARARILRHTAPRLVRNPQRARRAVFGSSYEDVERLPLEIAQSFIEPVMGTKERAMEFERWLCALKPDDLVAIEPALRALDVPALIVWGTGDHFFDRRWAYWLAERLPGARPVVELEHARLFFPDERGDELAPLLLEHWGMSDTGIRAAA